MQCQGEQGQYRTFCSSPLRPIKICRHLSCWPGWLANWNRIGIFSSVFWALSGRKFCDHNTQIYGPSGHIHKHPRLHYCTLNRTPRRDGLWAISALVYSAQEKVNSRHLRVHDERKPCQSAAPVPADHVSPIAFLPNKPSFCLLEKKYWC